MNDLLALAIDAHGGLDRWIEARGLDLRASLSGYFHQLKEQPAGMVDKLFDVDVRQPAVSVSPFPTRGQGTHDVMIHAYNSYAAVQAAPDAQLILYPRSGHGFLFQHAASFARDVHQFLDTPQGDAR